MLLTELKAASESKAAIRARVQEMFAAEEKDWDGIDAAVAEFDRIAGVERVLQEDLDGQRLKAEAEDLYAAPKAQADRAKANAETWLGCQKVAAKQSDGFELPQPLIARDSKGVNRVHAMPAVFTPRKVATGPGEEVTIEMADLEASFRYAEIIRAGMADRYDPATGDRVDAAPQTTPTVTTSVPASIPDLVMDLVRYEIQMNEISQFAQLFQSAGIQDLPFTRRVEIPKAVRVAEDAQIATQNSVYANATCRVFGYKFLSQWSRESEMTIEPWSIMAQAAMDGGMGLGLGTEEELMIGTGTGSNTDAQPQGIHTYAKGLTGSQLVTKTGAANFKLGWSEANDVFLGIPTAYLKSPGLRWFANRASGYKAIVDAKDTQGVPIWKDARVAGTNLVAPLMIPTTINDNLDDVGNNKFPIVLADLTRYLVRRAGQIRVEPSDEYGYDRDRRTIKFVSYCGGAVLDVNPFAVLKTQT